MAISEHPASSRRYLIAGSHGVLVEFADGPTALAFYRQLEARMSGLTPIAGVTNLIPAACTVLIEFLPGVVSRNTLIRELDRISPQNSTRVDGKLVEIPVSYDGEDLSEVLEHLQIGREELIARHTSADYRVGFTGFAPGFAYLITDTPTFDVPRRAVPRTRVAAGSVALFGAMSGVYPRESPGGTMLIGTTRAVMWDTAREHPALLQPGDRVKFVEFYGEQPAATPRPTTTVGRQSGASLTALVSGMQSLIQDGGRSGYSALGVPKSGALDLPSLRRANRIVGNSYEAAALEILFGPARFRANSDLVVAITGASAAVRVDRADGDRMHLQTNQPIGLQVGDELVLGHVVHGLRLYLAVRGGIDVAPELESRSSDTLSGLGPEPINAGDTIWVSETASQQSVEIAASAPELPGDELTVPILLGPRDDWFDEDSVARLFEQTWEVTPQSNRIGIRLHGERPLRRVVTHELPSEGMTIGAIEVPSGGQPVVFLADHPVTGGYPVIATVTRDSLPALAQARPGTRLTFVLSTTEQHTPQEAP